MTARYYAVQFLNVGGSWEHSRFFNTVRAARSWARWLMTRPNVVDVKVARGGHGGSPVPAQSDAAGCGALTRVAGTNGGLMPCGATLHAFGRSEPYYCAKCRPFIPVSQ